MRCSVCWDELDEGNNHDALEVTECNHRFHRACLQKWLEENNSCPLCRHQLRNDDEEEEAEIEDGEIEDEGFEEFEIVYYNVSEMLSIYDIFQAICMNYTMHIDNEPRRANPIRIPEYFQHMMEILPDEEFDMIHRDENTVEIIYEFLEGQFNTPEPRRGYSYDSDYDPELSRMLRIYESFARHRRNGYYEAFERFLNSLRSNEEYMLFRTRNHRNLFERFN